MSLIQEALRRKEEEQGVPPSAARGQILPPPAAPLVPPPGKAVSSLRVACYIVLFLGAGAGLYSLYRSFAVEPVRESSVRTSEEVAVSEEVRVLEQNRLAAEARLVEPIVEIPEPRPRRQAPAPRAEPSASGSWPELKVMGVFARPEQKNSSAMLDGMVEEVGATVMGVTLVEVRQNGVLLRYGGEEKFVRVGRTTLR